MVSAYMIDAFEQLTGHSRERRLDAALCQVVGTMPAGFIIEEEARREGLDEREAERTAMI